MPTTYTILPFHWGSRDIWISEWIAQFTLGLTPLIVHVLSGAPPPSYLSSGRPEWHDLLCLFNPITILWRYAAIADRRIRSQTWGPTDIAVSNAIFWTARGWDGSTAMLTRAIPYAARLPDQSTARVLSLEMLKTVIVFLQGIQAISSVIGNFTSTGNYTTMDTISGLFIPIGASGLLRLCAAPWLTDDFVFGIPYGVYPSKKGIEAGESWSDDEFEEDQRSATQPKDVRMWQSRAFRALFMVPIMGCFALAAMFISPWIGTFGRKGVFTTTSWLVGMYYVSMVVPMMLILGYYFISGPLNTTIIPCMSKMWYKCYCLFMVVFTAMLILVAAIEMRPTVCGKFTTLPYGYEHPCAIRNTRLFTLDPTTAAPDGNHYGIIQELGESGQFMLMNFTGSCLGVPGPVSTWRNATIL